MNCDQFIKALASGSPLNAEAQVHSRDCPACARLVLLPGPVEAPALSPALENRILAAITGSLAPVQPLAPAWLYALAILAVAAMVAAAGILKLGVTGWTSDSLRQNAYFTACILAGLLVSAVLAARRMAPGARILITPAWPVVLATLCFVEGALLYPESFYDRFARAVVACISIGLAHAAATVALAFLVVRRGAAAMRLELLTMLALAGGLTGMAVLYVFCPHRDLWHFLLGHAPVPLAATALGAWIGRRIHA